VGVRVPVGVGVGVLVMVGDGVGVGVGVGVPVGTKTENSNMHSLEVIGSAALGLLSGAVGAMGFSTLTRVAIQMATPAKTRIIKTSKTAVSFLRLSILSIEFSDYFVFCAGSNNMVCGKSDVVAADSSGGGINDNWTITTITFKPEFG
jgi:hypothetical protein